MLGLLEDFFVEASLIGTPRGIDIVWSRSSSSKSTHPTSSDAVISLARCEKLRVSLNCGIADAVSDLDGSSCAPGGGDSVGGLRRPRPRPRMLLDASVSNQRGKERKHIAYLVLYQQTTW